MNFKPIGSLVLLEYEEDTEIGKIALPEGMDTFDYSTFVVRDVGNGYLDGSGTFIALPLKPGDRVHPMPSAKGNLHPLPPHLCDGRKLAVLDIRHLMGAWIGEMPKREYRPRLVKPATSDEKILVQ